MTNPNPGTYYLAMKRFICALAAIGLTAAGWVVHADNLAFPVTLRQGKASSDEGEFGINRGKVVGEDHLVLVVDRDIHEIRLVSVDDDTNLIETIMVSSVAGILSNGEFAAIVDFEEWDIPPNLEGNTGSALLRGELR